MTDQQAEGPQSPSQDQSRFSTPVPNHPGGHLATEDQFHDFINYNFDSNSNLYTGPGNQAQVDGTYLQRDGPVDIQASQVFNEPSYMRYIAHQILVPVPSRIRLNPS
jgi:hypothetical protein